MQISNKRPPSAVLNSKLSLKLHLSCDIDLLCMLDGTAYGMRPISEPKSFGNLACVHVCVRVSACVHVYVCM
jgi:hypothetical protein